MAIKLNIRGRLPQLLQNTDRSELLVQLQDWFKDRARLVSPKFAHADLDSKSSQLTLWLDLHPGADYIEISIDKTGFICITSCTAATGPGYHAYLCDLINDLGQDLKISWIVGKQTDVTSYFQTRDNASLDKYFMSWFKRLTNEILTLRPTASGNTLCMPKSFTYPDWTDYVLSQLGPRHKAWVEAIHEFDSIDICPWWNKGFTAEYYLGRALCLMWNKVCWRDPILDEETELLKEISQLLEQAYKLDPTLRLPWNEWAEILGFLRVENAFVQSQIVQHMGRVPIGYRRGRMTVHFPSGWQATIPGSFCHDEDNQGTTFVGYDHLARNIRIYPFSEKGLFRTSAKKIIDQYEAQCQPMPLEHKSDKLLSKAFLRYVEEANGNYWMLHGIAAITGKSLIFTICFENEELHDWAVKTWHTIKHDERIPATRFG